MTIFIIIVLVIGIIIWQVSSSIKPKDTLMSSIMSGKDFPNVMVCLSEENKKYYLTNKPLNPSDKIVFRGTKYECENWLNQNK